MVPDLSVLKLQSLPINNDQTRQFSDTFDIKIKVKHVIKSTPSKSHLKRVLIVNFY